MDTRPTGDNPDDIGTRRLWRRWRERPLTGAIGGDVGLATLLVAGCGLLLLVLIGGGGSSPASEPGGVDSEASADSDPALKYAQCMRENGVPNFPDPVDGRIMVTPESGLDPNSPAFQAAQEACQDYAPQGLGEGGGPSPEMEEQVLAVAQCMRENGIDFPDPDLSGGAVRMQLPPSVDTNSPEFEAAQEECSEHLQGLGGMRRSAP